MIRFYAWVSQARHIQIYTSYWSAFELQIYEIQQQDQDQLKINQEMAKQAELIPSQEIGEKLLNKILSEQQPFSEEGKKQIGYFEQFKNFSSYRILRLKTTILGNYDYVPKNKFKAPYKEKIFNYLKAKYMTTLVQLEEEKPKKFTSYFQSYEDNVQYKNLRHMKQVYLKMKTNIDAAEDSLKQSEMQSKKLKADFYNEVAYEFDRQRMCSIGWGLLLGAFVCTTIYRRGNPIRKGALFLLCGHIFGQVSYYWNIDKYFDTVYPIFEEDALEFVSEEQKELLKLEEMRVPGQSVVEE